MSVESVLTDILDRHGTLTGQLIVDEARDPSHPLHERFDWDDTEAAEKWRVHQGEELIRSVKVRRITPSGDQEVVRRFIARREVGEVAPGQFISVDDVTGNPDREAALLAQMNREIETLRRRYSAYGSLFSRALKSATGT